jgi:hypothetical protein
MKNFRSDCEYWKYTKTGMRVAMPVLVFVSPRNSTDSTIRNDSERTNTLATIAAPTAESATKIALVALA